MALVTGGQLGVVRRILETGVDAARAITDIDLDNISQTLPVVPEIVRRSAPLAGIDGWFTGVLENSHAAADDENSEIFPYAVGPLDRLGNYPADVPEGWDIWLVGLQGFRTAGTGSIVGSVTMDPPDFVQGWGRDDAGVATGLTAGRITLGIITAVVDTAGPLANDPVTWLEGPPGGSFLPLGIRVPRGSDVNFVSTSDAAVTVVMMFIMGLFPMAMGHDVRG